MLTFYGLGYHQHRERWITDEWYWYTAHAFPAMLQKQLSLEEAQRLIQDRRDDISQEAREAELPSQRATLFAILADLTDEDAALSELDDLSDFWDEDQWE